MVNGLIAGAVLLVLLLIVGLMVVLVVQGRVRAQARRRAVAPVEPRETALGERIGVERLCIEIDREVERYRQGADITKGAPKERP